MTFVQVVWTIVGYRILEVVIVVLLKKLGAVLMSEGG